MDAATVVEAIQTMAATFELQPYYSYSLFKTIAIVYDLSSKTAIMGFVFSKSSAKETALAN